VCSSDLEEVLWLLSLRFAYRGYVYRCSNFFLCHYSLLKNHYQPESQLISKRVNAPRLALK